MDKTVVKILIILLVAIGVLVGALSLIGVACYFSYKPMLAKINYEKGIQYKQNGWPVRSKEVLEEAIELDPDGEIAKKAKIFIDTSLSKSNELSDEAITLNIKGFRLERERKYDQAIKMFKAAIDLSPDFEWPYSNMAMIYYNQYNDYDQAVAYIEKALALNPHYTNARMNLAYIYFRKARNKLDEKNFNEALNLFNKSLDSCMIVKNADPYFESVNSRIEDISKYIEYTKQQMGKLANKKT